MSGREGKARPRVPMGPSISRYSPRRPKSNIGNEALLRSRSFPTYSSLPAAPSASDTRRLTGSMQRIGTKRPVSTGLAIRVLCSPVPRATGSIFGTNVGMAQRAGEFTAADLAKRLQLCRRLVCVGRSRPIAAMLGASFGSEPETPTLHGTRARREAPGRSDRPFRIWERGPRERWEPGTTFVQGFPPKTWWNTVVYGKTAWFMIGAPSWAMVVMGPRCSHAISFHALMQLVTIGAMLTEEAPFLAVALAASSEIA